jgi:hypothetical protein
MPASEDSTHSASGTPHFSRPILKKPQGDALIDVVGSIALVTPKGLPS